MSTPMTLGQSLAGNWHLTVPNPEEDFCSTELAAFWCTVTGEGSPAREAMEQAAAHAVVAVVATMPTARIRVTSHSTAARESMEARIRALRPDTLAA